MDSALHSLGVVLTPPSTQVTEDAPSVPKLCNLSPRNCVLPLVSSIRRIWILMGLFRSRSGHITLTSLGLARSHPPARSLPPPYFRRKEALRHLVYLLSHMPRATKLERVTCWARPRRNIHRYMAAREQRRTNGNYGSVVSSLTLAGRSLSS